MRCALRWHGNGVALRGPRRKVAGGWPCLMRAESELRRRLYVQRSRQSLCMATKPPTCIGNIVYLDCNETQVD